MKKTIYIVLILIAVISISCKKNKVEYWSNGVTKYEIPYKGDKMNGTAVWYWENGNKQLEANYKDDVLNGKLNRWFFDEVPQRVENYIDGKLVGNAISYNQKGVKISEENYVDGLMDGKISTFFDDGSPKVQGNFKMGKWNGKWLYFDDSEVQVGAAFFVEGKGTLKTFSILGKLIKETPYVNQMKEGKEIIYDEKGQVLKVNIYQKDILIP